MLRLGGTDDKIVQYWLPHADGSATDPPPACQPGSTATNLCLNASRWAGARTTSLLHHFNAKNNIVCQDRLGTNVGKVEREGSFYAAINEFAEATGLRLVFGLSLNATQNARLIDHSHRRSEIQKKHHAVFFPEQFCFCWKTEPIICQDRLGTQTRVNQTQNGGFERFPYVCPEPVLVK